MKKRIKIIIAALVVLAGLFSFNAKGQSATEVLKEIVTGLNDELPMDDGNGFIWKNASLVDNNIVFRFSNDESKIPMDILIENKKVFGEVYLELFAGNLAKDDDFDFVDIFRVTKVGLKLTLVGLKSAKMCSVSYSNAELLAAMRK
ncbi:MAG: hypothetical protein J1F05_03625 [Muribaculaceae bacterium]|nr:hypothetical protein [Muribaculaceae bacterium]